MKSEIGNTYLTRDAPWAEKTPISPTMTVFLEELATLLDKYAASMVLVQGQPHLCIGIEEAQLFPEGFDALDLRQRLDT